MFDIDVRGDVNEKAGQKVGAGHRVHPPDRRRRGQRRLAGDVAARRGEPRHGVGERRRGAVVRVVVLRRVREDQRRSERADEAQKFAPLARPVGQLAVGKTRKTRYTVE